MTKAKSFQAAAPRERRIALVKTSSAASAIGPLLPGMEVFCLTFGQFSLIDAVEYLVHSAGKCQVVVSTWTAAVADAERAKRMLDIGNIERFRLVVDRSFIARQPVYCARVTELFGPDAIRTTRTHAKFALIHNDHWSLCLRTSMNLNANPRLESLEISDDPDLVAFMLEIVDGLYEETPPGATVSMDLPSLPGVRNADARSAVAMGRVKV